ncbi:hypothetical protein AMATHDRAFT_65924 [Amanita thiersii Skay4041]|uniref:FAD-binding PCMH-type domain-containing protein n=1 Tax=Amanita thiersii Skay4041 TaxID=703135 RepID=A0A2A9NIZ9_9AGAR|nr:hypothetical protein AMATHDRAFT_65924 [Amanita thiersii Skay4041]
MFRLALLDAVVLAFFLHGSLAQLPPAVNYLGVCQRIEQEISPASEVFYPVSALYLKDNEHWASSSAQFSTCSVEPGTTEDLGKILRIVGKTRTPFGVKSGGHSTNPKFSSTEGVQIALFRFSEVTYDSQTKTAVIGSGLVFDDVYAQLEPYGVSVLGGRVTGIGVGGFLLGGGYSWQTNQYGLAIDSITAYELIKPNGEVVNVSEASDPELFFGLKGGFNNFGIVTRFTMKTIPQGPVWGGAITYLPFQIPDVSRALLNFASNNKDPKACLIGTYTSVAGQPLSTVILFYNDPNPPSGTFDSFLKIPSLLKDVSQRSVVSHIKSAPSNLTTGLRGVFHTVPLVDLTPKLLDTIFEESKDVSSNFLADNGISASYNVEPFHPTILTHGNSSSAYPPTRDKAFYPFNMYVAWLLETGDDANFEKIRQSADRIRKVAVEADPSIADAPLYPNYAIFDTPLEKMYGGNVDRLKALRSRVDPDNVMGLTGGFKFV